jgi:hypothetical protein
VIHAIAARRATRLALGRLARGGGGRVHSVFPRTLNLVLEGLGDAGWVSLHVLPLAAALPSPFGVACPAWPPVAAGEPVVVARGHLRLGAATEVEVTGAAIVDTTLPVGCPAGPGSAPGAWLAAAVTAGPAGLAPVVAACLGRAPLGVEPLARRAGPALAALRAATAAGDADGCVAAGAVLLGLGPGLTPAGDDLLAGWLAGAGTAGAAGRRLARAAGAGLLAAAAARTGALSRACLAAVVAGAGSETLHRFLARPTRDTLEPVLTHGASSGADLVAGLALARTALGAAAAA